MQTHLLYDEAHGSEHEGWYLRIVDSDGQEEDIILDAIGRDNRCEAQAEAAEIIAARRA